MISVELFSILSNLSYDERPAPITHVKGTDQSRLPVRKYRIGRRYCDGHSRYWPLCDRCLRERLLHNYLLEVACTKADALKDIPEALSASHSAETTLAHRLLCWDLCKVASAKAEPLQDIPKLLHRG